MTPDDRTAYIVIATAVGMAYLPIFSAIRYFVRRATEAGLDDILLMCSTILALVQSGIILRACSYGLGRSAAITQTGREGIAEKVRDDPTVLSRMGSGGFDFLVAVAYSDFETCSSTTPALSYGFCPWPHPRQAQLACCYDSASPRSTS